MSVVITGATGHLGRLVVESLLERGFPAGQIVATGRRTEKIADLADRGVVVRRADYTDSGSLKEAFQGADKVLLVSSSEVGQRYAQHVNAVDAARAAGVGLIAYTSITRADTSGMALAAEHNSTEEYIRDSGVPHVLLRNNWYLENYTDQLSVVLEHQALLGSAGEGRVNAASRADLAAAAATVLATDGHQGQVYELAGEAFTLPEAAAVISEVSGRQVAYVDLPAEKYAEVLVGAGVPQPFAEVLADSDLGIARGDLDEPSDDLSRLIGRPATSLRDAVTSALA
ncbi:MAG TPA: SDR family oxidoreductase [Nocardioidaceae bacterium]|nr:SDR family oxidoreductase [Nocardioidaceae bacterium]